MTNEPSPRPWRVVDYARCPGIVISDVFDASGSPSGLVAGELKPADAALIVDAVNAIDATKKLSIKLYDPIRRAEAERDHLRDIVRQMAETLEHVSKEHRFDFYDLVREARAAIGEDKE